MAVVRKVEEIRRCDFCAPPREGKPYVLSAPLHHHEFDICDDCRRTVTLAEVQAKIAAKPGGAVRGTYAQLPYLLEEGNKVTAERTDGADSHVTT